MGNIFGDTDDITFGGDTVRRDHRRTSERTTREHDRRERSYTSRHAFDGSLDRSHLKDSSLYTSQERGRSSSRTEERRHTYATPPRVMTPGENLLRLVESMKPSYLADHDMNMRLVMLSPPEVSDPLVLIRSADTTLMIGTGYSTKYNSGKIYPTLPDLRLPYSEKSRLAGWIILEGGFDLTLFQMEMELLGFPYFYGTREVIAYIRDHMTDNHFIDKCRFFELFVPGSDERKIADWNIRNHASGFFLAHGGNEIIYGLGSRSSHPQALIRSGDIYTLYGSEVRVGEIIEIFGDRVTKQGLKFTFDTFYLDGRSVGVVAGYTLKDREDLAGNGVLTFVIEEDVRARAIVGHIFIDSRGFVHAYEMMSVHKEILKGIRHTYESTILANPGIERAELVSILRREITKYCYVVTGRTPVVMPIIIER